MLPPNRIGCIWLLSPHPIHNLVHQHLENRAWKFEQNHHTYTHQKKKNPEPFALFCMTMESFVSWSPSEVHQWFTQAYPYTVRNSLHICCTWHTSTEMMCPSFKLFFTVQQTTKSSVFVAMPWRKKSSSFLFSLLCEVTFVGDIV